LVVFGCGIVKATGPNDEGTEMFALYAPISAALASLGIEISHIWPLFVASSEEV